MISLLMSLAILAVIILSLAGGVGLGYITIFGILQAFDRSRHAAMRPAPVPALNVSSPGN